MNENYIRCTDKDTITKLKQLGFVLLSERDGIATFLNNPKCAKKFSTEDKVVYTNKIEL